MKGPRLRQRGVPPGQCVSAAPGLALEPALEWFGIAGSSREFGLEAQTAVLRPVLRQQQSYPRVPLVCTRLSETVRVLGSKINA